MPKSVTSTWKKLLKDFKNEIKIIENSLDELFENNPELLPFQKITAGLYFFVIFTTSSPFKQFGGCNHYQFNCEENRKDVS